MSIGNQFSCLVLGLLKTHKLSLFATYHQNYTEFTPFSTYVTNSKRKERDSERDPKPYTLRRERERERDKRTVFFLRREDKEDTKNLMKRHDN